MKPSGVEWLGDVPAHWRIARAGALFRPVRQSGSDELPTLSISIERGVADEECDTTAEGRKIIRGEDKSVYQRVASGDIAYNMMRAWQGAIGLVRVNGQVSPAYVVLRPRTTEFGGAYYESLLRTTLYTSQITRYSKGITSFRWRLYWEDFKSMPLLCPPFQEQLAITDFIAAAGAKMSVLGDECRRSIALMQEHRAALISAAVTGKIDVREPPHA